MHLDIQMENDAMKNQIYVHYQREASQIIGFNGLEGALSELVELLKHVQVSTQVFQEVFDVAFAYFWMLEGYLLVIVIL